MENEDKKSVDAELLKIINDTLLAYGVEHAIFILKDKKGGFHQSFFGDAYTLNGMLDFAKRDMFLKILAIHEKDRKREAEEYRKNKEVDK